MGFRILIVDDSEIVHSVIEKTIEMAGIPVSRVFNAKNGLEALEILAENKVDIVLADINMPVMNGIEMLDKMAEKGWLETIPVLVISTEGSYTRIEQLKEKGVRGYIRKPFAPEKLSAAFKQILGEHDNEL